MWELWDSQQQQRKSTAAAKLKERESKRSLENVIQETIQNAEKLRPSNFGESKTDGKHASRNAINVVKIANLLSQSPKRMSGI